MFASFWLILIIFSYNYLQVKSDISSFSHDMGNGKVSASKSLLKSIIESFEERSQIYCVVVIHDDIGINFQSTFLSKSEEGNVGIEPPLFLSCKAVIYDERLKVKKDTRQKRLLFCRVSLFIFGHLSYTTALVQISYEMMFYS